MDASMVCVRAAFIAAAATALSGCSGGPDESDVRQALVKQAEITGVRMISPNYKEEIGKARIVGCVKADAGGYACDVSSAGGQVANLRFVNSDQGWAVAN